MQGSNTDFGTNWDFKRLRHKESFKMALDDPNNIPTPSAMPSIGLYSPKVNGRIYPWEGDYPD